MRELYYLITNGILAKNPPYFTKDISILIGVTFELYSDLELDNDSSEKNIDGKCKRH